MKRVLAFALTAVMLFSLCSCSILNYISSVKTVGSIDFEPSKYDTCYYTLNEQQQEIYKVLYNCALLMPEGFVTVCDKYEGDEVDLNVAYTAMLYDNPQIFWMPVTYMMICICHTYELIVISKHCLVDKCNHVVCILS